MEVISAQHQERAPEDGGWCPPHQGQVSWSFQEVESELSSLCPQNAFGYVMLLPCEGGPVPSGLTALMSMGWPTTALG